MKIPTSHHDVVVVGARCAGAATALLLARRGHDVLMVDRTRLPADTISTHSLVRGGVVQLSRWGLLDAVVDSGAPEVRSFWLHHGRERSRHTVKERAGVDFLLAPRRHVLDEILANSAVAAGASLRTGVTVTGLLRDPDGRVTGVTARDRDGGPLHITARLVIGADGVRSRTARYVDAPILQQHQPSGAVLYTYVDDLPWDGFEFHFADRAFAGAFPTHDAKACVWLIRPTADMADVIAAGADRLPAWLATMDRVAPDLARRIRTGSIEPSLRGSVGLPNHVRQAAGPGWALVGDAGYHRDPITGHGIADAFRDAELLTDAVDATLRDEDAESVAMQRYQQERDAAIKDVYALTRELGGFPEPHEFMSLMARLGGALNAEADALAARPATRGAHTERAGAAA